MKLESARELKAGFLENIDIVQKSQLDIRAFDIDVAENYRVEPFPRTAAIGIAPAQKPDDYRVAIRIQSLGIEDHRVVQDVVERARGEVDVQYIGPVTKQPVRPWTQDRHRPLLIGCSIGHYQITAGTMGALVSNEDGTDPFILSNNHVLANENDASRGDAALQPGRYDGGSDVDKVAVLDRFVRLDPTGINRVDCALASLDPEIHYDATLLTDVGILGTSPADAVPDDRVEKIGRTTAHTTGRVTAFELDNVVVGYDLGQVRFDGQIQIEGEDGPFSAGGDSGSLIFKSDGYAPCALLFAGSVRGGAKDHGVTFANPISEVITALKIRLLN